MTKTKFGMTSLEREYLSLAKSVQLQTENLDYSALEKRWEALSAASKLSGSALSVYDLNRMEHIYESENHRECFRNVQGDYAGVIIHPDDYEAVMKNAIAAMKYVFLHSRLSKDMKMIREYRAWAYGKYRRVTEQFLMFETDSAGSIWLTLSIVDISPNQSAPYKVSSRLINFVTGDVFSPLDQYYDADEILSKREIEILKWVERGKLSKEISGLLNISINTVNTHRQRILERLQVDNSMEAVRYAQVLGLLDD